jgi:hypothetical protein
MPIDDVSFLPNAVSAILEVAATCLEGTPDGRPTDVWLYHTAPPADCCQGIYAWVESIGMSKSFPGDWTGPVDCVGLVPVAKVALRLYRPCWPVVKDNPNSPFPPGAESDVAAANLQMDAVKLICCLTGDLSDPGGVIWNAAGDCLKATIGTIQPVTPSGGCAGWTIRMSIELPSCCI